MNHAVAAPVRTPVGKPRLRFVASFVALALLAGCSGAPSADITVTGTVDDSTSSVVVPAQASPVVDVAAGFPDEDTGAAGGSHDPSGSRDPSAVMGLGSTVRIASVKVREGDTVTAGQVLATLDDRLLKAQLAVAKADQTAAKATVAVLAAAIETTHDKEAEIADKRSAVEHGIAEGTRARQQLSAKLAQARKAAKELPKQLAKVQKSLTELKTQRAKVRKQLDAVNRALAALPPDAPPAIRDPLLAAQAKLTAAIKQLDAGIAKLTAGRKQLTAAIRRVDAGIPKLARGIATLDANLAKARDALSQLDRATDRIRKARATLKDAKKLAEINADAAGIPVSQARAQLHRATLTAPVPGVIIFAASRGSLLAPGAGVVTIRATGDSAVTAWLSPAQAARVCPGDAVQFTGDWMPAGTSVPGSVTWLGSGYQYPPTDSTTDEIHLSRALPVRFTAIEDSLPAGVPVDINIASCRTAAEPDPNG